MCLCHLTQNKELTSPSFAGRVLLMKLVVKTHYDNKNGIADIRVDGVSIGKFPTLMSVLQFTRDLRAGKNARITETVPGTLGRLADEINRQPRVLHGKGMIK